MAAVCNKTITDCSISCFVIKCFPSILFLESNPRNDVQTSFIFLQNHLVSKLRLLVFYKLVTKIYAVVLSISLLETLS